MYEKFQMGPVVDNGDHFVSYFTRADAEEGARFSGGAVGYSAYGFDPEERWLCIMDAVTPEWLVKMFTDTAGFAPPPFDGDRIEFQRMKKQSLVVVEGGCVQVVYHRDVASDQDECVVLDYDNNTEGLDPEEFEKDTIGCTLNEFVQQAKCVW